MGGSGRAGYCLSYEQGVFVVATTGELRAIIEALELVDIGDAASYLGEEDIVAEALVVPEQVAQLFVNAMEDSATSDCTSCKVD